MILLEFWLLVLAFAGLILGGWSICWARTHSHPTCVLWGRRLFVLNFLALAASGLVAAFTRADALVSLGLLTGLLLVAMLWESPAKGPLPVEE